MAKFVYSMLMSLDGYVDHMAFEPDAELFDHFIAQMRGLAGSIYGRKLYQLMEYWDGDDWDQHSPDQGPALRAFAQAWRAQPKWVVSSTLASVGPNATLIARDAETAIRRLKAEQPGEIEVGGPDLAQSLTEWRLIDEYVIYLTPVILGQGSPFFRSALPPLRLLSSERIGADVVRLAYAPA
jgi:dihydrofolate reductase